MSLFFRERRSATTAAELIPPRAGSSSFAEPVTAATAPQVVAFGASVNLLASLVAAMPVKTYNAAGGESERLPSVLADPAGAGHGLGDWLATMVTSAATTGNAVGVVLSRDSHGVPLVIEPVDVRSVRVWRDADTGRVRWEIGRKEIDARDVCHYRRYPVAGRLLGASPVEQFANTLGLALASERFGRQWFTDGAHPSGVLETDQPVTQSQAQAIKERVLAAWSGSREPAVLGNGMSYRTVQIAPEESQFLETQKFTSAQCARILGPGLAEVLGYPAGDSLTYTSREQAAIDLLTYTLDPWLVGLETALSRWLGGERWVQFNRGALLRTDLKTRFEAHRIALGGGEPWATVNEIRDLEDAPGVPWGDGKPGAEIDGIAE